MSLTDPTTITIILVIIIAGYLVYAKMNNKAPFA